MPAGTLAAALVAAVGLASFIGCDSTDDSLSGLWLGTFSQDAPERQGTMRLSLSQSGGTLGGNWEVQLPRGVQYGGTVEGSVAGSVVDARLLPNDPEVCPCGWSATAGEDPIAGRYAAFDCRVEIVGEIDVRRQ